jgi:hypothetical protein
VAGEKISGLSERGRANFRKVVRSVLGGEPPRGQVRDRVPEEVSQSPQTYVVRVPDDGIPGMDGSGTGSDDLVPGSVRDADVYQLLRRTSTGTGTDDGPILRLASPKVTIYNLGSDVPSTIPFVVVTRDAFGSWWVTGTGSGSGTSPVVGVVHVTSSSSTGTDETDWYCQRVVWNGLFWMISSEFAYEDVVEMNGLHPRKIDSTQALGETAHAVTILYQDEDGNYFIDYPLLSSSDTLTIPDTYTCVDDFFVPATYKTVEVIFDNYTAFPNVSLRTRVL